MTHSPEPWTVEEGVIFTRGPSILDAQGNFIITSGCDDAHDSGSKENMERAVACVNACKGVSTEHLLSGQVTLCWHGAEGGPQVIMAENREKLVEAARELLWTEGYKVQDMHE